MTEDDQYLYHGSSNGSIELFQPRQAMSFGKPDGLPAVHASDELDPAVFMAVLGSRHVGGWGLEDGTKFGFFIVDSHFDEARQENWSGYVYVLPKDKFTKRRNWEWAADEAIKPIKKYEVGIEDLPKAIHMMTQTEYDKYHLSQPTNA